MELKADARFTANRPMAGTPIAYDRAGLLVRGRSLCDEGKAVLAATCVKL
jgi:hypothetical protein